MRGVHNARGFWGLSRWVLFALYGACLNSGAFTSEAIAEPDPTSRLQAIKAEVESAESEIATMKGEFNALLQKRGQIESSLTKLKEEDRGLEKKIEELKERERALASNVEVSEKRVSSVQKKIQLRLRATYMTSTVANGTSLSRLRARGHLERLSYYVRKVRNFDAQLFREATNAITTLRNDRAVLHDSLEAQTKTREELRVKRLAVEAEGEKLKAVTEELAKRQRAAQTALARLHSEAKKVEVMIAALTSKDEDEEEHDESVSSSSEPEGETRVEETPLPRPDTDQGPPALSKDIVYPSLFDSVVKVSAPVKGEVLQGFGRSKMTNFADIVRSKGIEFSTPRASEVYSVLDGKVAYVGVMPGYEQVVVVEHGGRSYSLYGRLSDVTVKVGDRVAKDQAIATTSPPDEKGRTFYFEVRRNGVPVNPETVLTKVSR